MIKNKFLLSQGTTWSDSEFRLDLNDILPNSRIWKKKEINFYDIIDDYKPNYLLISSEELDRASVRGLINDFKNIQIILYVRPDYLITEQELYYINQLFEKQRLNTVFRKTNIDFFKKINPNLININGWKGFNQKKYFKGTISTNIQYQIIGLPDENRLKYYDKYLKNNVRIISYQKWPVIDYVGYTHNLRDTLLEAAYNIYIPKAQTSSEMSETIIKTLVCTEKVIVVTDINKPPESQKIEIMSPLLNIKPYESLIMEMLECLNTK